MKENDIQLIYDQKRAALFLTGCDADADDIIQDVALSIWKNKEFYSRIPADEKVFFITRCIKNRFIDFARRSVTKKRNGTLPTVTHTKPDVHGRIALKEVMKIMEGVDICKSLKLFAIGYSIKEVAEIMGTSGNTTIGRVRYGREYLRKHLNHE